MLSPSGPKILTCAQVGKGGHFLFCNHLARGKRAGCST